MKLSFSEASDALAAPPVGPLGCGLVLLVSLSSGSTSISSAASLADTAKALLYVGQPEQADVPPVPSQRPSPGQVPPDALRWGPGAPFVSC